MKARAGVAAVMAALAVTACGPPHHQAENTTDSTPTADEGEIKGVLTQLGGADSSPEPVVGTVDVYTQGGKQVADSTSVSAWNFELKPGAYRVQAMANGRACEPVVLKIVKGTVQEIDIGCPVS